MTHTIEKLKIPANFGSRTNTQTMPTEIRNRATMYEMAASMGGDDVYWATKGLIKMKMMSVKPQDEPSVSVRIYSTDNRGSQDCVIAISPIDCTPNSPELPVGCDLKDFTMISPMNNLVKFNTVFANYGKIITNKICDYITNKNVKDIYLSGVGTGGAVAQCVAYFMRHSKIRHTIYIYTFGSPRIGNSKAREWFASPRGHVICRNYAAMKKFGHYRKIDPACLYPVNKGVVSLNGEDEYVDNHNLIGVYKQQEFSTTSYHIDQESVEITKWKKIANFFNESELFKWWREIHNFQFYLNAMSSS